MAQKFKRILISGDSFAVKWPNTCDSWLDYLEKDFSITRVARAGIGEYKILKQIEKADLDQYDCVIISHTSPSRIHVPRHPLHTQGFHDQCDLIYNDLSDRLAWPYSSLSTAKGWFDHFYDDEYQMDIYDLIREKINSIVNIPYISMSHIDILKDRSIEKIHMDFSDLWRGNRGDINHYNKFGNKFIADKLKFQIGRII